VNMKKLFLILLIILPLTITAAPTDVPVTEFFWDHDGVDAATFDLRCNGSTVVTVPEPARSALISDANLPDGPQDCVIFVLSPEGYESNPSNTVNFTMSGGIATVVRNVPGAATLGVR